MWNSFLPSLSSEIYGFGTNEAQIPNFDVSMQMECKNVNANNLCMESRVFNHDAELRGYPSTTLSFDNISQQSILFDEFSVPHFIDFQAAQNARKRPIGTNQPQWHSMNTINHCKKIKKEAKEQFQHTIREESQGSQGNSPQVQPRRGQKLGDKITTLQKLVSPYGKTDTASVLQEAHLYIKLLQKQIQNLFHVLSSSSYNSSIPLPLQGIEAKKLDLKSRGIFLVPISTARKLTKEMSGSSSTYLKEKYQI